MQLFRADAIVFSKKIKKIFDPEKVKKQASKVAHNRPRPTAHSPELIFHIFFDISGPHICSLICETHQLQIDAKGFSEILNRKVATHFKIFDVSKRTYHLKAQKLTPSTFFEPMSFVQTYRDLKNILLSLVYFSKKSFGP